MILIVLTQLLNEAAACGTIKQRTTSLLALLNLLYRHVVSFSLADDKNDHIKREKSVHK